MLLIPNTAKTWEKQKFANWQIFIGIFDESENRNVSVDLQFYDLKLFRAR